MNEIKSKMRIFVLIDDIPSKEHPHSWAHVFDQFLKLSNECEINVVAPVCLTLNTGMFNRELPSYAYKIGEIKCWRPRYLDFSFLPYKFRNHYFQICTMIISLLFLIIRKKIRFDLIHAHFVYRPGFVAAILGKILGKPVVITAHGSDIHQNLIFDKRDMLLRNRTISALSMCNKIIFVSEFLENFINDKAITKKIKIIPCGFSRSRFYFIDKQESRNKLALNANQKILLFAGNLVPVKGADILIKALKYLRDNRNDVGLLILGDGNEREKLKQQAYDINVSAIIHFLGRKKPEEMPLYINAADVVVIPSRAEGRSVVVFEALACGRPVVATHTGGIPETIINDSLGILVEKEDPIALAKAIDKALARKWDSKYQSDYVERYADYRTNEMIMKVYEEALGIGHNNA